MTHLNGKPPYHPDLNNCPWQCKIIANSIQAYVKADSLDRDKFFEAEFLEWGFGPYWDIAKQLISDPLRAKFSRILEESKDRRESAHRIVFFIWDQEQPVSIDLLQTAEMYIY